MSKHKNVKNFFFLQYIKMESRNTNNVIKAIKEVRELFNELKSNYSRKEIKEIREKLYKKEAIYNFLKEKEQKKGLADNECVKEYWQVYKEI